jgi:predicted PurR-regulated permease PerM
MVDQLDEVEAQPAAMPLNHVFAPRPWLRDLGRSSWLLVGFLLLIFGLIWLLAETYTIVGPVLAATIVGVVTLPVVDAIDRHAPRALAAAAVLLGLVAIAVVVVLLVLGGISGQRDEISTALTSAVTKIEGWVEDVGVSESSAESAGSTATKDAQQAVSTLLNGVVHGIRGLASLLFGLSFAALSLFFILKDGPGMRDWIDRHLGLPPPAARIVTDDLSSSLRGYFRGVTLIAAFNGVVVGIGALLLGVPLAGTIAIVSVITAYIPYIGAFVAGGFAVLIALGSNGTTTALIMLLIVLLANGLLQNIVQPFAMGAALGLNPLVVLVVTIGAGCLFGTIGLVLAAPLVSAATHIVGDLRRLTAPQP